MFISVQVYCCNHHFSLYRNWNKNKLKKRKEKELPQKNPCSGSNADAEIRSLCSEHRAAKVLPLKPGVGQNTAMHASPAAWNFLLVLISTLQVHSPTLLFSSAYIFNCTNCGKCSFPC